MTSSIPNHMPKAEKALPMGIASLPPKADPVEEKTEQVSQQTIAKLVQNDATRCWSCNRKVGLLGFKCKCTYIFCSKHRYSDQHKCDVDYLAAHKEYLVKNMPKVEASKILKISNCPGST